MSTLKATNLQNASSASVNIALDSSGNATVANNLSVDNDLKFDSGYGSTATAYGCRAWVKWHHGNQTIQGNGNVSSVTDYGAGNYGVSFTNSMPDTYYSCQLNLEGTSAIQVYSPQTTGFTVWIYTGSSWYDANFHAAVFR